jgi:hypothetical protein
MIGVSGVYLVAGVVRLFGRGFPDGELEMKEWKFSVFTGAAYVLAAWLMFPRRRRRRWKFDEDGSWGQILRAMLMFFCLGMMVLGVCFLGEFFVGRVFERTNASLAALDGNWYALSGGLAIWVGGAGVWRSLRDLRAAPAPSRGDRRWLEAGSVLSFVAAVGVFVMLQFDAGSSYDYVYVVVCGLLLWMGVWMLHFCERKREVRLGADGAEAAAKGGVGEFEA